MTGRNIFDQSEKKPEVDINEILTPMEQVEKGIDDLRTEIRLKEIELENLKRRLLHVLRKKNTP